MIVILEEEPKIILYYSFSVFKLLTESNVSNVESWKIALVPFISNSEGQLLIFFAFNPVK